MSTLCSWLMGGILTSAVFTVVYLVVRPVYGKNKNLG